MFGGFDKMKTEATLTANKMNNKERQKQRTMVGIILFNLIKLASNKCIK